MNLCPDRKGAIEKRFEKLNGDLDELNRLLQEMAESVGDQVLVASHPVYNYMARAYGLSLVSLHWEPEQMPSKEEWVKLDELVKEHTIRIMLWEDQPDDSIAKRVTGAGLRIVVFRPCGNRPPEGDYLTEMKQNIQRLCECLQ